MLSQKRGILPLAEFISSYDSKGCILADKVIGKAAALLCIKAQFKEVYAHIMSLPAIEIFRSHGIPCSFRESVVNIKNREGNGLCPMESLSEGVMLPDEMYDKAVNWLKSKNLF